jgi:HAMP domain-containing protein
MVRPTSTQVGLFVFVRFPDYRWLALAFLLVLILFVLAVVVIRMISRRCRVADKSAATESDID